MTCQNIYECVYDIFLTGHDEVGLWTLESMNMMFELKYKARNAVRLKVLRKRMRPVQIKVLVHY